MTKNILLLSIVLLLPLTILSADAQTPNVTITTDKSVYYYGDDIVFTIQFSERPFSTPQMSAVGTVSESVMIAGHQVQLDENNRSIIIHPTYSQDFTKHSVMPNDGLFTAHIQYTTYDPQIGFGTGHVATTFMYIEYPFGVPERFDAIEENVTRIDGDIATVNQEISNIHENVFDSNQRISVNKQDILDLQNTPVIPADLLSRISILENQTASIPIIEASQSVISDSITALNERISNMELEISNLDADITTLQSQQLPTNAELQTSIDSTNNDIMMMGLDVSSLHNDLDNPEGLWSRVNDLQTDTTDMTRDITILQGDVNDLQIEITTIANENATPQDVEQNLRIDGIESNITNLFSANQTQSDQIDEIKSNVLGAGQLANTNLQKTWANEARIIAVETDVIEIGADIQRLEQVDGKLWNDMILGKEGYRDNKDRIETLESSSSSNLNRIEGLTSDISDLEMTNYLQVGDIQTLRTDIDNLQIADNPNDDQQNLRLMTLEDQARTFDIEIDGLIGTMQQFGVRIAGVEQSIIGFIDEHVRIWDEFDAVWRDMPSILSAP